MRRTIACCVVASACSSPPLIETDRLLAVFHVEGDGDTTTLTASLQHDDQYPYALVDGESITATVDGVTKGLADDLPDNIPLYTASFDPLDASADVTVVFGRPDGETFTSTVQTPTPFEISTPPATASRAADLTLTYTPAGPPSSGADIAPSGDCITIAEDFGFADTGTATIVAGSIKQDGSRSTCTIAIVVRRRVDRGDLDSGLQGNINAFMSRTVSLTSTP